MKKWFLSIALVLAVTLSTSLAGSSLDDLIKKASAGDAHAQFTLGFMYSIGSGVAKDPIEAFKWFRKAADQGNDGGQFNVGFMYANGSGVAKDPTEAVKWYRKAADQGYAPAQSELGCMYANGRGVAKDPYEAVKWFRKAAEQGHEMGAVQLGSYYLLGLGVIKDEVEGGAWLYVAAAKGEQNAVKFLPKFESQYQASTVNAARSRAKEIQSQIDTHSQPRNNSTPSIDTSVSSVQIRSTGTGAFITPDGYLLTAAHVVKNAIRLEIVTVKGKFPAKIFKVDEANDIAVLKCVGMDFIPLPLLASKEVRFGQSVFTLGFPNVGIQGFDPKVTKGEISGLSGLQDDPRNWQISVPVQPGNSGGPLCDESGNIIGIVVGTLDPLKMAKIKGEIPQNVNFAVKNSYMFPLLEGVSGLPTPNRSSSWFHRNKFEDVVEMTRKSVVLVLVY